MRKEDAEKWAADLEANPDKQGEGYLQVPKRENGRLTGLKDAGKNCCLGRLMLLNGWTFSEGEDEVWIGPNGERYERNSTESLPRGLAEKLGTNTLLSAPGLAEFCGVVDILIEQGYEDHSGHGFANVNDLHAYDDNGDRIQYVKFPKLAEYIRKHYEEIK